MYDGNAITLEQLLDAREKRAEKQLHLMEKYNLPLISFTVNMPGIYKNTTISRRIFHKGCKVLQEVLDANGCNTIDFEQYELDTGHEAYLIVDMDAVALKEIMLQIEGIHPIGRLFDLDVIGLGRLPISREELGHSKRICLLCDQEAHVCSRNRSHSVEELTQKIKDMVEAYI